MIAFASCFTMGKAQDWYTFAKFGLDLITTLVGDDHCEEVY
jgi:hypothetical protein